MLICRHLGWNTISQEEKAVPEMKRLWRLTRRRSGRDGADREASCSTGACPESERVVDGMPLVVWLMANDDGGNKTLQTPMTKEEELQQALTDWRGAEDPKGAAAADTGTEDSEDWSGGAGDSDEKTLTRVEEVLQWLTLKTSWGL